MKQLFTLLLIFLLSTPLIHAQSTPESCECVVDIDGLPAYLSTLNLQENSPLRFEVQNQNSTFAVLHGYIDVNTPTVTQNFINSYPNVTTLVFMQMPGSENDDANLEAAQLLKNRGYKTYLPAVTAFPDDAFIASGAVDMFLLGSVRVIDVDGEVGVHSWSNGSNEATDFPVGHSNHLPYINYYISMGFSQEDAEAFYYFTINAAPANDIHLMTEAELEQYKLRTCKYAANPTYTATITDDMLTADLSGATYQWLDCDNGNAIIGGAISQTFSPSASGNYAVQVTEGACSGISTCYEISGILPIKELFDFEARLICPMTVQLDWQINESATNDNALFIERSKDARTWELLIEVKDKNQFIDSAPHLGTSYYRLKQADINGQVAYTDAVGVVVDNIEKFSFDVYPNPTSQGVTIAASSSEFSSLGIYNVVGEEVSFFIKKNIIDANHMNIDMSNLSPGIYFIKTKMRNYKVYKK